MEKLSLVALLDEDREMVLASLASDPALLAAQASLEKAVDRLMYRYCEACDDPLLTDSAQHILQAMKNALPLMDAVGEARTWNRQAKEPQKSGLNFGPMAMALLLLGLVLVMAAVLGVLIGGRMSGALTFLKALLPVALGCGALYWAGVMSGRPKAVRAGKEQPEELRTEFLVDGEKAWHCLRGAVLQADGQLERIREEEVVERHRQSETAAGGKLDAEAVELFAGLLETAYAAAGDDNAREAASAIRFYLHNRGVDVVDYAPGRESWFEFLPASGTGTMRPALTSEGRLVRKGLASR